MSPKSNQICPNLTNFAKKKVLLGDAAAFPAPTALMQARYQLSIT